MIQILFYVATVAILGLGTSVYTLNEKKNHIDVNNSSSAVRILSKNGNLFKKAREYREINEEIVIEAMKSANNLKKFIRDIFKLNKQNSTEKISFDDIQSVFNLVYRIPIFSPEVAKEKPGEKQAVRRSLQNVCTYKDFKKSPEMMLPIIKRQVTSLDLSETERQNLKDEITNIFNQVTCFKGWNKMDPSSQELLTELQKKLGELIVMVDERPNGQ